MRLPSIDRDYWELRSAVESHRAHPDEFWIPEEEDRNNLKIGSAAKLIFDIETEEESGEPVVFGERMWVIVAERLRDTYIGILDNTPACVEPADDVYLCFGAEVPFRAEHVIDIAQPPEEYVRWQLSMKPERRWPRDEEA